MAEEKKMSVDEVVELFKLLEKRDSDRNSSYDEVLQFYGGDTYKNIRKKGFIAGITNAISSIFQPRNEDIDASLTTPINLVKPAIENKVAFLALPPTIRVLEPPAELMQAPQQPAGELPTPGGMGLEAPVPPSPGLMGMPSSEGVMGIPAPEGVMGIPAPELSPPEGQLSEVPSPPEGQPKDQERLASEFADKLEKVIITFLSQSNMPQRCRDVAWSMCAMDGAVIGVWPDMRHQRPRVFTRTPQDFYPVAYDADGLELQLAAWVDTLTGTEVASRFPDLDRDSYIDRDEVEVISMIDEGYFYTVVDKKEWGHEPMKNTMEIVPIVCVGSLGVPGMIFGSTDVKDAIPVARQINYHMYLVDEMASALVKPTLAVRDPLNVPDDVAIGRGGVITMGKDGDVSLLGPLNLPNAFWQLSATLQSWFDMIADNPDVLRADDGGGLTTGKGFNAKLGPIAARMQTRLEILMSAWRQVIKYMLVMWYKFPGGPAKMKGHASSGKDWFYIEAEPNDFVVDGDIWTEVDVFLQAQSYLDRQGNAVEIMQLYQNELISWDDATDSLMQVQDRTRTRRKIEDDRRWKAEGMAIANQAAQSPMTANTRLFDQAYTNYGLEKGFTGEMKPMPGPEAKMPPMMGEEPETGEGGPGIDTAQEVVQAMQDFFASIPKLQGRVWIGGDPISNPQAMIAEDWNVTVWVEVAQDKGTITRAAEGTEVYGHITFIVGEPTEEGAIQVAEGSEISPLEEAPTEEGELEDELGLR